ncbi:MAG: hypothetical protein WDM70_11075 [Nitrosomonadales bacterium]
MSVAAFQVFNSADQGTPHSTKAAVSLYYPNTERGKAALSVIGRAYGSAPPVTSEVDGWTIFEQHPNQNGAAYTVLDAKKAMGRCSCRHSPHMAGTAQQSAQLQQHHAQFI